MDLFRCICEPDKDWDWYSYMTECFLKNDEYNDICREISEAWEKEIGESTCNQSQSPNFDKCAYESIREEAQNLDEKETHT